MRHQINDPNGLVWVDGLYHLFHQYNVKGNVYWGHATSHDLVHWRRHAPALAPDDLGAIWSGTAVVDITNRSGFGRRADAPIIALYTYANDQDEQSIGLADSVDQGVSWRKHPANPVLENPGQPDFRDPKILWDEPRQQWVMLIAAGDRVEFWRSQTLTDWDKCSEFGAREGAHGGAWECPDLFQLPVAATGERRWILSVSVQEGAPAGGSGMQYFVGDFDGTAFTNDNPPETVLWQAHGPDYYAGITWGDAPVPDDRRLMIAWADNWAYREQIPTEPFNGQLSLVRELRLVDTPLGLRLSNHPAVEYRALRRGRWAPQVMPQRLTEALTVETPSPTQFELIIDFEFSPGPAAAFEVSLLASADNATSITVDAASNELVVDRSTSGSTPSGKEERELWERPCRVPLIAGATPDAGTLHIFVDRSCVEVFASLAGGPSNQATLMVLPNPVTRPPAVRPVTGNVTINRLECHELSSAWGHQEDPRN